MQGIGKNKNNTYIIHSLNKINRNLLINKLEGRREYSEKWVRLLKLEDLINVEVITKKWKINTRILMISFKN